MAGPERGDVEHAGGAHQPRPLVVIAVGVAAAVAHQVLSGWAGIGATVAFTAASAGAIARTLHRRTLRQRRAWYVLIAAITAYGASTLAARLADVAGTASSSLTFPLGLVGYCLFLGAAMTITRARRGGRALADLIDMTVIASALSLAAWRLLWWPFHPSATTGRFFFLCVIALTVALGVRVTITVHQALDRGVLAGSATPSMLLLASFFPVTIAGAAATYEVVDRAAGSWVSAAWTLTAVLLVATVREPSLSETSKPAAAVEAPIDHWRLWLIGAATPVPLLVGLFTDLSGVPGAYVFGVGIVMNMMVTVRAGMAFRQTQRELAGRVAAETELQVQVQFDALTGLANRSSFQHRLEQALARAQADGDMLAVLYLDLDRFKIVNDSFGQRAGDHVLVVVGERLRTAVRDEDTLARLSGDEFAVVLEDVDCMQDALAIAERIREAIRQPIPVAGTSVTVGTSIGLCLVDEQSQASELLRDANVALGDAKQRGRNAVVAFDASLRDHIARNLALEHDLASAVDKGEMRLVYQPQIDLATGAVAGVEALVRWEHPTHGLLHPGAFIEIAENTGLIVPIGRWAISEACRQHRRWQATLGPELVPQIAINVSPTQLTRDDVAGHVREALKAARLDAAQFHVEITEVALLGDSDGAVAALNAIESLGVAIAVDDFGTGYFSLSHLRRFPVHRLKIDQTFVRGVGESAEDEAIINATIDLAHSLGLSVVAEGVETEHQLAHLRWRGCDAVQGYLFAEPLPPHELASFVRDWARPINGTRVRSLAHRAETTGPGRELRPRPRTARPSCGRPSPGSAGG
jgi:diguanylate cyclase (GGDEF)-like protein